MVIGPLVRPRGAGACLLVLVEMESWLGSRKALLRKDANHLSQTLIATYTSCRLSAKKQMNTQQAFLEIDYEGSGRYSPVPQETLSFGCG